MLKNDYICSNILLQIMKTIPLTRGYFTKVDDGDYEKLAIHRWCADVKKRRNDYCCVRAIRRDYPSGKTVYMSRVILGATRNRYVDHINGDTLDNCKSNLRFCTLSENSINKKMQSNNKSGYIGVFFRKQRKKWVAQITTRRKQKHLGYFNLKEEAAHTYDKAAIKFHGEFARLNFPK